MKATRRLEVARTISGFEASAFHSGMCRFGFWDREVSFLSNVHRAHSVSAATLQSPVGLLALETFLTSTLSVRHVY